MAINLLFHLLYNY